MKKQIKETVAQMTVAQMRKAASKVGIKNASKYKREELEPVLVEAMVAEVRIRLEAEKQASKKAKAKKAVKVENDIIDILATEIVENLQQFTKEELFNQNRKVLIVVMKMLHCERWYRIYDKATMVKKITEAVA